MDKELVYFDLAQTNLIKTTLNKYNEDLVFGNQENGFVIITVKRFGYLTEIYGFDGSYSSFRSFSAKKAGVPFTSFIELRKGQKLNIEEEDDEEGEVK